MEGPAKAGDRPESPYRGLNTPLIIAVAIAAVLAVAANVAAAKLSALSTGMVWLGVAAGGLVGLVSLWGLRLHQLVRARERQLRERDARLRELYEHVPSGIFQAGLDGTIYEANAALLELLGFDSLDELAQYNGGDLYVDPDDRGRLVQRLTEDGVVLGFETQVKRRDGQTVWLELYVRQLTDDLGDVVGMEGAVNDVTDRRRAQQALRTHLEELTRSNAELERFAYVTSHDLKEPIRMVRVYAQLLAKHYHDDLDQEARQALGFIEEGTERMNELVGDLLTYARMEREGEEFELVDLGALVDQVSRTLSPSIQARGAEIAYDDLPRVIGDRTQLGQLFQNLLSNAVKFHGEDPPRVTISASRKEDSWHLTIEDNGIGIDPAFHDRVFEVFQRLHGRQAYPGTGVGLAICRRVVERHGGDIWVESEAGEGATFHVTLPDHPQDRVTMEALSFLDDTAVA